MDYYFRFTYHLGISSQQQAPNTHLILAGLRRLFEFVFGAEPTVIEILYLYRYKSARNLNYYLLEAN